eukprot:2424710-Amphidinium_carterae.1
MGPCGHAKILATCWIVDFGLIVAFFKSRTEQAICCTVVAKKPLSTSRFITLHPAHSTRLWFAWTVSHHTLLRRLIEGSAPKAEGPDSEKG